MHNLLLIRLAILWNDCSGGSSRPFSSKEFRLEKELLLLYRLGIRKCFAFSQKTTQLCKHSTNEENMENLQNLKDRFSTFSSKRIVRNSRFNEILQVAKKYQS